MCMRAHGHAHTSKHTRAPRPTCTYNCTSMHRTTCVRAQGKVRICKCKLRRRRRQLSPNLRRTEAQKRAAEAAKAEAGGAKRPPPPKKRGAVDAAAAAADDEKKEASPADMEVDKMEVRKAARLERARTHAQTERHSENSVAAQARTTRWRGDAGERKGAGRTDFAD